MRDKSVQSGTAGYIATNRGCPARFGTIENYMMYICFVFSYKVMNFEQLFILLTSG